MSPLYRIFLSLSFCPVVTFATTEPFVLLEQDTGFIGLSLLASDQLSRPPAVDSSHGAVTPSEREMPWPDIQNIYPSSCSPSSHCFVDGNSCAAGEQCCSGICIPDTQDCCSATEDCLPGDYCFIHENRVRCCPLGKSCFQIKGEVVLERTVSWYEEVHIVEESKTELVTLHIQNIRRWILRLVSPLLHHIPRKPARPTPV
ncbi:hypothetical protein BJX65DRAFT_288469 [Aspergillus insuetus]